MVNPLVALSEKVADPFVRQTVGALVIDTWPELSHETMTHAWSLAVLQISRRVLQMVTEPGWVTPPTVGKVMV
ncbi:hypothetical protein GCM10027347_60100 [Larkinella harenae]